jgi:catechol 2,3-dioxygenase-like lactoylglutathione lyase family enzyme
VVETLGLTHLGLKVRDLERSLRFYQEAFGAQVRHRGPASVEINTPGANDIIVLEQSDDAGNGAGTGVDHFGFRLVRPGDIDAAIADVERAGGTVVDRGEFVPGEPYLFAKDPDGYTIEVWYELENA